MSGWRRKCFSVIVLLLIALTFTYNGLVFLYRNDPHVILSNNFVRTSPADARNYPPVRMRNFIRMTVVDARANRRKDQELDILKGRKDQELDVLSDHVVQFHEAKLAEFNNSDIVSMLRNETNNLAKSLLKSYNSECNEENVHVNNNIKDNRNVNNDTEESKPPGQMDALFSCISKSVLNNYSDNSLSELEKHASTVRKTDVSRHNGV